MNAHSYVSKRLGSSPLVRTVLRLLLVLGLIMSAVMMQGGIQTARADYADGSGQGKYQSQIYWLDWQGFSFTNGQSRTFTLPGGVTVSATVSNVAGGAIHVGRPEDYGPAAMNRAYPNTGYTAINSCNACTNTFRLTFSADVSGQSVPVDLVAIDAESAAPNEYLKVTTDGHAWQLLEQFRPTTCGPRSPTLIRPWNCTATAPQPTARSWPSLRV